MPEYYTYKRDAEAAAKPGQTVKFTAGRGYYLAGTPAPTAPAPKQISDAASAGGYRAATKQPAPAVTPPQVSDAASGGGYGKTPTATATRQPTPAPTSPGTTTTTPVDRPAAPPPSAPGPVSDAASSGGYGSRYYTYRADAAKAAKPGQKVGFTTGKGYYLYYPTTPSTPPGTPRPPQTPRPTSPAIPAGGSSAGTRTTVNAPIQTQSSQANGAHPGRPPVPVRSGSDRDSYVLMTVDGPVHIVLESSVDVAWSTNTTPSVSASPSSGLTLQDGVFGVTDKNIVHDLLALAANPAQTNQKNEAYSIGSGYVPQLTYQGRPVPGTRITHFSLTQDLTFPPTTELGATTAAKINKTTSINVSYSVKVTVQRMQQPPPGVPVISKPTVNWEVLLELAALALLRAGGYGRPGVVVTP